MNGKDENQDASGRRLRWMAGAGVSFMALSLALAGLRSGAKPVSAPTLPSVTIGKAIDTIPFTVVDVALAEGYFTQNGINVKEELVQGREIRPPTQPWWAAACRFPARPPLR